MKKFLLLFLILGFFACEEKEERADAYGNFEATITNVSSEANGRLLFLNINEGQQLQSGALVAQVDSVQLYLQKLQLKAKMATIPKKMRTAEPDIKVLQDKKKNFIRERDRVKKLLEAKAATSKQLDDINGQIDVIEQQIIAIRSQTKTANTGILAEKDPILAQIEVIKEQIRKTTLFNPISGTVLTKLAESGEVVRMGSPLYRIASLDTLTLRAYTGGVQLQKISIGQEVEVLIDDGVDGYRSLKGKITWIANEAEFTPKTIQTKEERVNLVYAIKIDVANPDNLLKIGMPAEVLLNDE